MSARINTYCLIIWMSLLSFGTISCSNWLDVEPKSEIKGDVLFETEQGFEDAITGVYILMTDTRLYGKEMSYGFIEAVAQQYEIDPLTNNYFDCTQYRYDMDAVLTRIDGIWSVAYNAIANVNNILKNLETSSCVTPPGRQRMINDDHLVIPAKRKTLPIGFNFTDFQSRDFMYSSFIARISPCNRPYNTAVSQFTFPLTFPCGPITTFPLQIMSPSNVPSRCNPPAIVIIPFTIVPIVIIVRLSALTFINFSESSSFFFFPNISNMN